LQANLKMLESQQDALSDFQDMQALRLYKSRLAEYIEAHVRAGNLPRDPFQAIEQRLSALSEFFMAADQECKRLNRWKADWLNSVPAVGLAEMQSARTELAERVAEVPQIQESLAQRLSPQDWDTSSAAVDLHAEMLACAQCVSGLKLPPATDSRRSLYQFARGEGAYAKETSAHFTAMGLRIEELIALHAGHVKALEDTDHHLSNDDFRSAEKIFQNLAKDRFSDIEYVTAETRIADLAVLFKQFTSFDSMLDEQLEKGKFKLVTAKLAQLHTLILRPDLELGREALALLPKMEDRLAVAQKAHKNSMVTRFVMISLFIMAIAGITYFGINENAKAERVRIEAQAKAEAAYAKSSGNRAGEKKVIEIAPGVTITFCWCPAGEFTMGIPKSEADRSSDENQVEVTLSRGFWMAKTEVTQAQWEAVMGNNPSRFKGANRPVERVSWTDAQEFLTKLNVIVGNSDGGQMVLPTEAQWEYACRAGEAGMYSGGTLDEVAWYEKNSGSETHPVGTKKPNAWGLYDMHGNVWEWCADWYAWELKGGVDPWGANSGSLRVGRGGSWDYDADYCRVANRGGNGPSGSNGDFGFRVARSSVP
jgi:formylglycine-generating enzyme required for sulfatase activity